MKKSLFALSLLVLGTSAFAQEAPGGAQQIYSALTRVTATPQNVPGQVSGATSITNIKSVGGLKCYQTAEGNDVSYSCSIDIDKHDADIDAKDIFNALEGRNVVESTVTVDGRDADKREVSGLSCVRYRTSIVNRDFKCTLVLR